MGAATQPQSLIPGKLTVVKDYVIFIGILVLFIAILVVIPVVYQNWRGLPVEQRFSAEALSQIASILVATVSLYEITRRQNNNEVRVAQREIYQRLELESIPLFRFEAQNPEVIAPLWDNSVAPPAEGTAKMIGYKNYVCQILNLHEMALRFHTERIVQDEVLNTWLAWIHEVAHAPGFKALWKNVSNDYIKKLQGTYVLAMESPELDDFKRDFFKDLWIKKVPG